MSTSHETGGRINLDHVGVFSSSLCALHCVASALLPTILGVLGVGFLLGHRAEWAFTLLAITFAAGALALGWRKHRSGAVAALFLLGILGLLASRWLESGHGEHHDEHHDAHHAGAALDHEAPPQGHLMGTATGVLAGLLLVGGHTLNLRQSRRSQAERQT